MDWVTLNFERGRQDFRAGCPRPEAPPGNGCPTKPCHAQWYGWMVERALQLIRQERVREWAEEGGELPDL